LWWLISFSSHNEWQQKIFDHQKQGAHVISFLKKKIPTYLLGQLKKISHHLMVKVYQLVIKKFWLSFDTPHYPLVTKFRQSPKKRACRMFMETLRYKEGCLKKFGFL
jgi:hypothetical protein